MHHVLISSYLPIVFLLLPFFFLVICRRYFVCTYSYYSWVKIMRTINRVYYCFIVSYIGVCGLCFVLSNWMMDGSMNIIILRLHPTRGSLQNVCLVANAWYNCSRRYDMRSEFGVSSRERPSGKKRQVLYHFGPRAGPAGRESGPPAVAKFSKIRIRGSDARAKSAGPTRGSAENNSRVIVTRPASDRYLTGHDPTRPVRFENLLPRPDPTREN